jgi:hypothetical protein
MSDGTRPRRFVPASAADGAIALAGLVLLGATAFGLWHLIVGGLISGNPRAGAFGLALGSAAGIPLVLGAVVVRRRRGAAHPTGVRR